VAAITDFHLVYFSQHQYWRVQISTPKHIINEALSLSPDEKTELVDQLLSNIDAIDSAIEEKWASEAESRADAYDTGKLISVSLEEVLAKYK